MCKALLRVFSANNDQSINSKKFFYWYGGKFATKTATDLASTKPMNLLYLQVTIMHVAELGYQ